ncbi:MAG: hypothetical protein HFJ33_07845, partial [Clostridia bacterium]|nr:hypothetical protein [Clostridia bacterium]
KAEQTTPAITLSKNTVMMTEEAPELTLTNTAMENGKVSYVSSDENVVTIDETAKITLVGTGKVEITVIYGETANYSEKSATVTLEVTSDTLTENSFVVENTTAIYDGKEKQAKVTADVEGVGTITVVYKQGENVVTPVNAGEYDIYVNVTAGDKYDAVENLKVGTLIIQKAEQAIPAVTISSNTVKITEEAPTLTVFNTPMENGKVTYTSSNENVITMNEKGEITLIGVGEVEITVTYGETANYSEKSTKVILQVIKDTLLETNFMIENPTAIYDTTVKDAKVTADVDGIGEISVIYKQDGSVVTPINAGKYDVYVNVTEGIKYGAINDLKIGTFTINKAEQTTPAITLSKNVVMMTEEAPDLTLNNSAMEGGTVTFTSSDENVVTVDENGNITLVGAGKAEITVTYGETANYTEKSATVTLEVTKDTLTADCFIIKDENPDYDGDAKQATVTTDAEGMGSFTVTYKQNGQVVTPINAGEYEIFVDVVAGTKYDAISDLKIGTLTIQKIAYSLPNNVSFDSNVVEYDGNAHKIEVAGLPEGIEVEYQDNEQTNAGIYTAIATFHIKEGSDIAVNHNAVIPATKEATLTITKRKPSKADIDVEPSKVEYNGNPRTDVKAVPATNIVGMGEIVDVTYCLRGTNNVTTTPPTTVGTYDVRVTVKEGQNYTARNNFAVGAFKINPKAISEADVTVKVPEDLQYNQNPKPVTVELAEGVEADYTVTYLKDGNPISGVPTERGTYVATVVVTGKGNYTDSITINQEYTITKTLPEYVVPTDLTAIYGQTLADVKLPAGFTFEDALSTTVGNAGTNSFKVTYTPDDVENYEIVTGIDVNIVVEKAEQTTPAITLSKNTVMMTEEAPELTLTNTAMENGTVTFTFSDEKVVIVDDNGNITLVGAGKAEITVTYGETANYSEKSATVTLEVTRDTLVENNFIIENPITIYDTTVKDAKVTVDVDGIGTLSVIYKQDGSVVTPINAGKYDVYVNVTEGTKYGAVTDLKVGTLTINQAEQAKPVISLSKDSVMMTEEAPILTVTNLAEAKVAVTYRSSNENVATIDETGKITLMGSGTTTITVTYTGNNNYVENSSTVELTVSTNKSALEAILKEVSELIETDYSEESWKALQDAIKGAEDLTEQAEIDAKVEEIREAINGLTVDKTELEAIKAQANDLEETDYSVESWAKLEEALALPEDKQSEIDAKVEAIQEAINGLTVDKTELEAIKAQANDLEETDYSVESWAKLEEALALPEDKQSEINAKVEAIQEAMAGLTVDKTALEAIKAEVEKLNKTDYSEASWADLEKVLALPEDKQSEVNAKVEAIQEAMAGLSVDKTALEDILAKVEDLEATDYSEESWKALQNAVAGAEDLTKQSEIDNKVAEIQQAIDGLKVDKTALEAIKAEVEKLNKTDYSEASWTELEKALAMPEDKQSEIDAKVEALKEAMAGLSVDKTALEAIKAQANDLEETDYSVESWAKLEDALALSEDKQSEVDAKVEAIQEAITGLTVDKTALEAIKAEVAKLNKTDYSEASWAELEKALALPEDKQSEVNAKVEALKEAMAGLSVDKTALEAIKAQANDLEETDYS